MTSRINRLRYAFPRRRGIAIDSVIHQRARYQTQLLDLLAGRQLQALPAENYRCCVTACPPETGRIRLRPPRVSPLAGRASIRLRKLLTRSVELIRKLKIHCAVGFAGGEAVGGLKVVGAPWAGTEGRELDGMAALAWLGRAVAMVEVLGCGSAPTSLAGSRSRKALRKPMSDWLEDSTVNSDPADAIDADGEADSAGEEAADGLKVVGAAWMGTDGRELDGVAAGVGWLGRAAAMVEVLGCGSAPTSLAGSGSRKALRKPMSDWLKPDPVDAIDVDGEADGAGEGELSMEEAEVVGVDGGKGEAELGPEDGVDAEDEDAEDEVAEE